MLDKWGLQAALTLYVDDMTVAVQGNPIEAAQRCAEVVQFIIDKLENDYCLVVNETKSVVTASNNEAARMTAAFTTSGKLRPKRAAKLLGVGTNAGRDRMVKVQRARMWKFRSIISKFQKL